jgi:hypothetical protein
MADCRRSLPEHDLTLHLVSGKHTSAEGIQFFRSLDSSGATRWLSYFDPTVDMAQIALGDAPEIKRVIADKRRELFGDHAKPYAIVCGSEISWRYFSEFWRRCYSAPDARTQNMRCFQSLEEAYDWFELPQAGRAAVARTIEAWETARATDA